ncbi:MAG: hypothetical protein KAV87_43110 [Desulfobacteraceae bacterium]|nr:hypothetical protein [Desulfobacteraceae bacterium]
MKRIKYGKLMVAILYVLFAFFLTFYFAIAGSTGVFVISLKIIRRIIPVSADNELLFIVNVIISILFGMIPFGLVAMKYFSACMKKWKVPTIEDALK